MKLKYNSPVILNYAIICMLILFVTSGFIPKNLFSSPATIDLRNPIFYFKLFSHVAGHANWNHFLNNFMMILLVGPLLEEKYGSLKIIELIFVTAIITAIFNILLFPSTIVIGSSGIAFMLILLSSFSNIRTGEIPITFLLIAFMFLGKEIVNSLSSDNISQFSHLVGGSVGAFYGFIRK